MCIFNKKKIRRPRYDLEIVDSVTEMQTDIITTSGSGASSDTNLTRNSDIRNSIDSHINYRPAILKKKLNARISIDKYPEFIPVLYNIIMQKPNIPILELNYENPNTKIPWCHNNSEKIESLFY